METSRIIKELRDRHFAFDATGNHKTAQLFKEAADLLDLWNDPDCDPWQDAHDETQASDKPWRKQWINEKARMRRFIDKYKDEALKMKCFDVHSSKYD